MKKLQKYIAVISLLVIGLNLTSIIHYNFLNAHMNFTVFADEPEECTGDDCPDEAVTPEDDTDPDEAARQAVLEAQRIAEDNAINEQIENYNAYLEGFQTCIPTNIGDLTNKTCNTNIPTQEADFNRLLQSIANNEIRTVLEEPLGNENIFKRARVCKTKFLKDRFSRLQPVGINNVDKFYDIYAEEISTAQEGFFEGKEFLITTGACEEFYVKSCQPQNNRQTSIGEGDPLPIQVTCDQVQVLFATSGTDLIKNYVGLIYRWAAGIIGVIAVLVIVINGIRMSQSGGDQGKVDAAKNSIVQSLIALAVLFLAGILLSSINPNFFTQRDISQNPNIESPETE